MIKEESAKYSEQLKVRITQQQSNLIKSKALETNCTESELVRNALMYYINRSMSDNALIYSAMQEIIRKVKYLENKIDLTAMLLMQQTKHIIKTLPNKQVNSPEIVDIEFKSFIDECSKVIKLNHGSMLESWIMDLYEQDLEK